MRNIVIGFLGFLLLFISVNPKPAQAFTMGCTLRDNENLSGWESWDNPTLKANFIYSKNRFTCLTKKERRHLAVRTYSAGPELFFAGVTSNLLDYRITCPLMSEKKLLRHLMKRGKLKLGAVRASVGASAVGGELGVALSPRAGVCTITSFGFSFGAGLTVDSVSIEL